MRPHPAIFRSPEGESAYLAAYDAAMERWPVPYKEINIPGRFGMTHVVVSGPENASPLVLLHGYMATSMMWTRNIADLTGNHRVYAVDVMGQPGKSIPDEPIRSASDYARWFTETLDGLGLGRISLAGVSYGAWLSLNYAFTEPGRIRRLVLLSPAACFQPLAKQFMLRGMLMVLFRFRYTFNSFMRWLGFMADAEATDAGRVFELMYLGLKHFYISKETLRVAPTVYPDDRLRALGIPTLLLMGEREVIYNPVKALARARRLIPHLESDLVPHSSHEMCASRHEHVDARILEFLRRTEVSRLLISFIIIICLAVPSAANDLREQQALEIVRKFYTWAITDGKQAVRLEPHIKEVPGSTKFFLDTSTLRSFTNSFMRSGYFAPEFADAVARYYNRYKAQFEKFSKQEFDEMARDGRGPLMGTEDMDFFFCAQEYEYRQQFVDGMKIKSAFFSDKTAKVVVESPYRWETEFRFVKVKNQWLISGYCMYQ